MLLKWTHARVWAIKIAPRVNEQRASKTHRSVADCRRWRTSERERDSDDFCIELIAARPYVHMSLSPANERTQSKGTRG